MVAFSNYLLQKHVVSDPVVEIYSQNEIMIRRKICHHNGAQTAACARSVELKQRHRSVGMNFVNGKGSKGTTGFLEMQKFRISH